jgi:DNA-binding PucR family transcriptional regulator
VLQLLMNGQTEAAQAVAGALRPQLPETIRVWVIEGAPCLRDEVAAHLKASAPGAWIVPCGVCDELLIVLAPVTGDATTAGPPSLECVQAAIEECWVGVSDPVALADTATGYAQAFHALAAAHHRSGRQAAFASSPDLALAIGPAVADWAEHFLAPLRTHSPRRSQDPGSTELLATAASWLSFSSQATKHLEIHRNTLSARLKRIGDQLHLDLDRLSDQSALALAVRTFTAPHPTGGTPAQAQRSDEAPLRGLDGLLAQPAVAQWARSQFQPLTVNGRPTDLARTLTVWLHHNACVEATAAALSLSTTAVRKRLTRAEELMQRFLLRSPTARHDLYLAQRALDLARPAGTRTNESWPPAPSDRLTRSGWRAERPG